VIARSAAALLALLAAGRAAAYARTISSTTGVALAWPVPIVPWQLNPEWPHASPSCAAGAALGAVQGAFSEWQQGCANLQLPFGGDSTQRGIGALSAGQNVVMFRGGWCSQDPRVVNQVTGAILDPCMNDPDLTCGDLYGCFQDPVACIGKTSCAAWGVVALTTVLHDPTSGRILSANVELVGWDGAGTGNALGEPPQHGWYFTCYATQPTATCLNAGDPGCCTTYGENGCTYQDLQNTLTHEAGHFIGLAHSTVPGATMNPTTHPGETAKRTLSADDVAGVCAVYPTASGGCGCGGGEGAGALSLLLLAAAARGKRRARGLPRQETMRLA